MSTTAKDLTLDWVIPITRQGSGISADGRFLTLSRVMKGNDNNTEKDYKYNSVYLKFNGAVMEKYFGDSGDQRVAFSFDKDRLIMVFNPPKGVPFFKMAKTAKARIIYNTDLIAKIYKHLGLDTNVYKYLLKIHHFAQLNGMELKMVSPYDYQTKLPLWEREIEGKLFEENEFADERK